MSKKENKKYAEKQYFWKETETEKKDKSYKKEENRSTDMNTIHVFSVSQCTDTYTQKRIRPGNLLPWK
ncbi:MAG: hypothetical protein K1V83_07220, partial [Prevotella sp.]